MTDLQPFKQAIPEFVFKLHHILQVCLSICQKNQFKQYISWSNNDTQILIKNPKKLEDRVLPHFFRHKHLASFIRQLNMYKFNKVNKISKQRTHMYFKNQHFQRGQFQEMKLIKRSQKQKKNDEGEQKFQEQSCANVQPNPNQNSQINQNLISYKNEAQSKFAELNEIFKNISIKYPQLQPQMNKALLICQSMIGETIQEQVEGSMNNLFNQKQQENHKNIGNLLGITVREFPPNLQSMIYPSLCSLTNLDV